MPVRGLSRSAAVSNQAAKSMTSGSPNRSAGKPAGCGPVRAAQASDSSVAGVFRQEAGDVVRGRHARDLLGDRTGRARVAGNPTAPNGRPKAADQRRHGRDAVIADGAPLPTVGEARAGPSKDPSTARRLAGTLRYWRVA